jgi:DNA-binding NarL/FixJ family response regulator
MSSLRVLIAEDHALMRAGLRLLLERIEGVTVVAEAGDGVEAVQLITEHRPDIALLDIAMGGMSGLEVAAKVQQQAPGVRVIILSMHASEGYVQQALRAGAAGYLLKDSVPAELELAIAAVTRDETYLSPAITKQVVSRYVERSSSGSRPLDRLTPRQREIFRLIAEGRTIQEIANELNISVKTAEGHRAQLMERLNIHDVASLVRLAIREGVITPDG